MKKMRKILSAVMAVTMLAGMSVMPVSAEEETSVSIEEITKICEETGYKTPTSVEEIAKICEERGVDFTGLSEEEINEFYQAVLDNLLIGWVPSCKNTYDDNNIVSSLWNGFDKTIFLGDVYEDKCKYIIKDGEAYISQWLDLDSTEWIIPEEINGCKVVGLCGSSMHDYYGYTSVEKVVIPNTVRVIGPCAFACNPKLTTIELAHPDEHSDLYAINNDAFIGCDSLKEITCFSNSDLKYFGNPKHPNDSDIGIGRNGEIFAFPKQMRYDVYPDGKIDIYDLNGILKDYVLHEREIWPIRTCIMSPDGNDPNYVPDLRDVVKVKQYIVGLTDSVE